jgi:hypothetical protein
VAEVSSGWVKIHRKIWDNPVVTKDSDHLAVWIWLITHATHQPHDTLFNGKRITLQPGQLVAGRKMIANELCTGEYKVARVLNLFKSEQQIAQQATAHGSLISILNWNKYQLDAQQNAQPVHNNCTTSAQQLHTIQECKECKEVVVDARARVDECRWLSDRLTDDEWERLSRQYSDFTELVNRIDDQVTDPYSIKHPYAYFMQTANNLEWPRKH